MAPSEPKAARELSSRAKKIVLITVGATFLLYWIPFGRLIVYPLMLLSTLVHELGHGVTAAVLGANFTSFSMSPDGSGVAHHGGATSSIGSALISAGGLVGPACAAMIGFIAARREQAARAFLGILALGLVAAEILVIDNAFTLIFVGLVIAGLGYAAIQKDAGRAQIVLIFLSFQLALSVFSRGDYLFTDKAETSVGTLPSDTAQMANALGGHYWLWGLGVGLFSVLCLALGLWVLLRGGRKPTLSDLKRKPAAPKKTKKPSA